MKKAAAIIFVVVVVCLALTIGSLKTYKYADSEEYSAGSARISDKVKDLEINWVSGKVNIVAYDGDEIILSEEADQKLKEKQKMHWQLDGRTLRVQYAGSCAFRVTNVEKDLTVMLPDFLMLEDMKIIVVSAGVEADDLKADKLEITTVSGEVKAVCKRMSEVKAGTVSGDLILRFNHAPEKIKVEGVSGNVNICLPEDAGFIAEMDSVSGAVKGPSSMARKGDDTYLYGNGDCNIDVNTVSGSLRIDSLK